MLRQSDLRGRHRRSGGFWSHVGLAYLACVTLLEREMDRLCRLLLRFTGIVIAMRMIAAITSGDWPPLDQ